MSVAITVPPAPTSPCIRITNNYESTWFKKKKLSGHITVAAVALAAALGVGNDDEDGGRCGSKQQNQQQQKQLQRFSWGTAKIFLGLIAQTAKEQKQAMKTVIWSTGFDSGRKPLPSAPSWVQTRN